MAAFVLLGAPVVLAPVGYGLTYIKDPEHSFIQMLPGKVKKVTSVVKTNHIARVFAGIFTFGLTELMDHEVTTVKYFYEDEFIGSNEAEAAEILNKKGNKCYEKGDYEQAATLFARASDLAEHNGNINEEYKENFKKAMQKIKEEAERRKHEEAEKIKREEAEKIKREEAERIKREEAERIKREEAERIKSEEAERIKREEAERRKHEEAEKIKREEAEKQAREEALQLERARNKSKSLQEEAASIYQQAEALSSLELKLEKYEIAMSRCEEACAFGATEEVFNTLNKIFESCLKHGAHDEAEDAIQIVRKYFLSEAGCLENALANQQNDFWYPDYESRAHRQQEQQEHNRTFVMTLS